MNNELTAKLYKTYPTLFAQRTLPMSQTCMCWGFACGDGWYWLIDNLCSQLQWDIKKNGRPPLEVTQVKEKFGTLRFYTNTADDYQHAMISFAESLSASICEECGSTSAQEYNDGWVYTRCKPCYEKLKASRENSKDS